MSNENLNDFYNQNRFNTKLRERIDSYEPELSDSLWDRIEHNLVKKESRGKRVLWMVYVMAALLLLSSGALYYLASENKKLAETVKTIGQTDPASPAVEAPAFEYQMPETEIDITPNTASNPSLNNGAGQQNLRNTNTATGFSGNSEFSVTEGAIVVGTKQGAPSLIAIEPQPEAPVLIPTALENNSVSGLFINNKGAEAFSYNARMSEVPFLKENILSNGSIYPKVQPYFGLTSEIGSTRQKVEGPHAARFNHEHPLLYKSAGLKFGLLFRKGFFIESGISTSNTGTNLWYDFAESSVPDTLPVLQGVDSLVAGSRHAVNQQQWIDLPVQIGYKHSLTSRWFVHSQAGLTYSMINSFSGFEPNGGFTNLDNAGESLTQPFKNFWSMNVGLGFGYQFGRNWSLDVQGNYRRGITNMNSETRSNHPNRIAEYMNAKVGVTYIFR